MAGSWQPVSPKEQQEVAVHGAYLLVTTTNPDARRSHPGKRGEPR